MFSFHIRPIIISLSTYIINIKLKNIYYIYNSNLPPPIIFIKPFFFLIKEKYEKLQLMVELGVQFREGKD